MALVKPVILQIVGYHNSGKTTFIHKLLSELKQKGLRSVTIKHHGHGGKPDIIEESDSARHVSAGALASLVEGGGRMILQADQIDWTLEEKLDAMSIFQPDCIIIEGHKQEEHQKVVFIRHHEDWPLLKQLTNIRFVLYEEAPPNDCPYQAFQRNDGSAVEILVDYLTTQYS